MDFVKIVFSAVDIPLVIGIVIIIQILKKIIKIKPKVWSIILILFGFLAAFLKVEPFAIKAFIIQGFIYSAASEFVYQGYKTISDTWKKRKG